MQMVSSNFESYIQPSFFFFWRKKIKTEILLCIWRWGNWKCKWQNCREELREFCMHFLVACYKLKTHIFMKKAYREASLKDHHWHVLINKTPISAVTTSHSPHQIRMPYFRFPANLINKIVKLNALIKSLDRCFHSTWHYSNVHFPWTIFFVSLVQFASH